MLTVIIPTRNSEPTLAATLASVLDQDIDGLDVLVVDGGSTDASEDVALKAGARVIKSEAGRGRQLALGGREAQTPWLLFLHSDTVLSKSWGDDISRFTKDPINTQKAAYFKLRFDHQSGGAQRVAALANWRAQVLSLPYGDQGLLIHRSLYDEIGGYNADLTLMEDVDFVQRLGPMRLEPLQNFATTSAAKYRSGGWWAKPMRNMVCLALFLAGAPNRWIESLYK